MVECKHGKDVRICEVCSKNALVNSLMAQIADLSEQLFKLGVENVKLKAQLEKIEETPKYNKKK